MDTKLPTLYSRERCSSTLYKKNTAVINIISTLSKFFNNLNCYSFLVLIFFSGTKVNSQVIVPTTLPFERICADVNYNEFNVTFEVRDFPSSASYVVELSDNMGDFTNPVSTNLLNTTDLSVNRKRIKFAIPIDLVGSEEYSLRVKEKISGVVSPIFLSLIGDKKFSVYYKNHNSPFTINNLKATSDFCVGGSYLLSIDLETPSNNSPLKYPSLKYNWYRNNGPSSPETLVASNTNGVYTVRESGIYYAKTNYGSCTSDSYSNQVTVREASDDSGSVITSSLGNPFCPADGPTILNAGPGSSFQWFKDRELIEGAINQTYSASVKGVYNVVVGVGSCSITNTINLDTQNFTAELEVPIYNALDVQNGSTLLVNITTDALDASYKWYLDGSIISDAVTNSYLANKVGSYKVIVTQNTSCIVAKELNFYVTNSKLEKIPNIVSLSSEINFWDIPVDYKNVNTNVMILSSQGEVIFNGVDYNATKWEIKDFKSVNPVYYYIITTSDKKEKKGSITVVR